MSNTKKLIVVMVGGALSWGLGYSCSVWPDFAVVFASLSTASTATVGILTGFIPTAK